VTLAEINPALNDYARWRFERRGLSARFLDVGAEELPEAAFDFVSAVDVLEHVPDPRSVLLSLAAALRPGGTLFIHLPIEADSSRPMHLWHDPETLLPSPRRGRAVAGEDRRPRARLAARTGPAL
jgi:2-polyprenyl-3-methyl-5-hydroxy-6-metoxy-1,4-benzoquinol methylase